MSVVFFLTSVRNSANAADSVDSQSKETGWEPCYSY